MLGACESPTQGAKLAVPRFFYTLCSKTEKGDGAFGSNVLLKLMTISIVSLGLL